MIIGYTKPRGIGTNICVAHYRKKEAMCGDNCPFLIECKPFFEALVKAVSDGLDNKSSGRVELL
jgi:hypothetical protein